MHQKLESGQYFFIATLMKASDRSPTHLKPCHQRRRNICKFKRGPYSLFFVLHKCYQFLYGRQFIPVTDHRPLFAIFGPQNETPVLAANRLARWALMLSQYDYIVEYQNKSKHGNADALSCLPVGPDVHFDGKEDERDI